MISSIKDNRRLRGVKTSMRDRGEEYSYENTAPLVFSDSMSKEEHAAHQLKWKIRKRKANIKLVILLSTFLLIIAAGLYWLSS